MTGNPPEVYDFGAFTLEVDERRLLCRGESIRLSPKTFDVLVALARHAGRMVTREMLLEAVWSGTFVEEGILTVHISALRKVLIDEQEGSYIETVPKRGYRFVGPIRLRAALPPAVGATGSPEVPRSTERVVTPAEPAPFRTRWRVAAYVSVAALAVLFGIGLIVRLWTPVVPAAAPVRSLAVLPFDALVAGADTEHLQVGMADALTTRLAAVTELRVPPSAAVQRYARTADVDLKTVARQLNVDALLTGGVQRAGDQIRVTVQVTRAADGAQMWAGRFDAPFTGIFALQDEIAEQIAAKLVTGLTDRERASLRPRETSDPEAYELYLQGRQLWERRTPETIRTAIATLTRATELDPNFARAHAWLANAYAITASGLRPTERFPMAKAEALKSIQLDDRLADAHTALAFLAYKADWNWVLAEREFKRAVELDPTFVLARHWYGEFLGFLDRPDEALEQYRVARELDPRSVPLRVDQAAVLIRAGQAEVALQLIDEGLRGDPLEWRLYSGRVVALNALGRGQEALEDELKHRQFSGASAEDIVALREAYRKAGTSGLKQQEIALLKRQLTVGRPLPFGVASALAAAYGDVSDSGATLEWLKRAADLKEDAPLLMKVLPQYAFLRSDARFQALMHRVGLDTDQIVRR